MRHLTPNEIDELNSDSRIARELREHFKQCETCQGRVAQAQRFERVLSGLERAEPAGDLSAQIIARLPREARSTSTNAWLGVATLIAAMIGLALAYQTAFLLWANGAFDLVSYYTAQPEIVTMYPNQALGTLAAAIPWLTVAISLVMLAVTFLLTVRWTSRSVRVVG
jgi:hypothetical protein